jgi:DNA-binding helix-hairpin-helix protein with protein kinase domain
VQQLKTVNGKTLQLGSLLGEGGEGAVFEVLNDPGLVVKRYHANRVDPTRKRKLEAMVRMPAAADLCRAAAWPVDLVNGSGFGFVMSKAKGYELHDLFGPKSRHIKFPHAKYKFLVEVSYNLCAALDTLHKAGVVVGDFNHKNVLVDSSRTVRFLDCDSFQIRTAKEVFRCTVGVPDYLAPELHGKNFETELRNPSQDRFSLGVLIFQLLFMGRHPYAGVGGPDIELGESIKRHLFAYGQNASRLRIKPPPAVLPVRAISQGLLALFERAFAPGAANQGPGRPGTEEWAKELKAFRDRLIQCQVNSSHEFFEPLGQGQCPWCALYSAHRVVFFYVDSRHQFHIEGGSLEAILLQIKKLQPIGLNRSALSQQVPNVTAAAPPSDIFGLGATTGWAIAGFVLAFALFAANAAGWGVIVGIASAIVLACEPKRQRKREYRNRLESEAHSTTQKVGEAEEELNEVQKRYVKHFEQKKAHFGQLFSEYKNLPTRRRLELAELGQKHQQLQLEEWLDSILIWDHQIPSFGAERKRRLAQYGVETALDIRPSLSVPGVGPVLLGNLLDWRRKMESQFVYNPNRPLDPKKVQELDDALAHRKLEIEKTFKNAEVALNTVTQNAYVAFGSAENQLGHALRMKAQAKANYEAFV